jgi:pimeloyl-ACP methyl ester carboxylesterase
MSEFSDTAGAPQPRRSADHGGKAWLLAGAAAVLAGAAIANHLVAKRSERRNPPRGRFVTIDGVQMHYLERGVGPPVVLIHGNGVTAEDFELSGLLDHLAQRHRVIAFDRPGFGYTQRPRRRSWTAKEQATLLLGGLSALGVERAVVVGHSWGTLVALEAALEQPDKVAGLVLMSGYYWPTARLDVPLLSGPAIPVFGDVLRFTLSPLLGWAMTPLVLKQIFSPSTVPAHFKAEFPASISLRPSQLRATAADTAMMAPQASKTAARYDEITAPVLVIAGDGDKIVSFKHQSRRLAGDLLNAQLQVIEGAGHMIHHTAPDEVATGIEAFVDQIGPYDRISAATALPGEGRVSGAEPAGVPLDSTIDLRDRASPDAQAPGQARPERFP